MLQRQPKGILESHFWGSKGLRRSGHTERRCITSLLIYIYIYYIFCCSTWHMCSSVSNLKISSLHDSQGGQKRDDWEVGRLEGFSLCTNFFFPSLPFFPSSSALPTSPVPRLSARTEGLSLALVLKFSFINHVYFPVYTPWNSTQLHDFSW